MATDSSFLSEDQFLCSICLDVFTEPVSIPCGHNFCKVCISLHWQEKEQCKCPLCNHKFNKGLKLCVNTAFRDVVENFKKQNEISNNNSLKPGQVACDCCLSNKFKASKTCLVCLTSFCETHLEPHRQVDALKMHKLTNPVHNLEDKICKKHNRILELFCRNDQTRICVLCTEHSAHVTVPLEEEYVDKMAHMVKKKPEEQEVKQRLGKKGQKSKVRNKRKGKDEAFANSMASNQTQASPMIWFPNVHPCQCDICRCVPEDMAFSGRKFSFCVDISGGTSWCLGVLRETLLGKKNIVADPSTGSWLIKLENCYCMALHKVPFTLVLKKRPERVVVCVDYENGQVSFWDADTGFLIYCFIGCEFNGRIGLFCGEKHEGWVQRLKKKVENMTLTNFLLCCLVMVTFLIIIFADLSAKLSAASEHSERNQETVKSEQDWLSSWMFDH
uniref:zinc-binding protein A33-like n=1 Tax=Semicossyphus pulcher TaxID=241346 RepID=UPI0037E8D088